MEVGVPEASNSYHLRVVKDGNIETIHQEMVEISMVEMAFPCGVPTENSGDVIQISVFKEMVKGIKNPYFIKCVGNSMSPKILDGDSVIVETISGDVSKIKSGDIVVAYINNAFTIKRFFQIGDNYLLSPENQDNFKPYIIEKGDELSIIGIVRRRLTKA